MCQTLGLSRATSYRWQVAAPVPAQDTAVRAQIQDIAVELPAYGYRRIAYALQRRGFVVNRKRVLRLRREDHLLCLRKRHFVRTTDAAHAWTVYPNLLPTLTVDGLDQRWGADMTSVRLPQACVDLAVLLEAYSRRGLGWALEPYLDAELTLTALRVALTTRGVRPGRVHQSERGVQ
jgi:transposase InsO family protein